jgi:hypothetical protein
MSPSNDTDTLKQARKTGSKKQDLNLILPGLIILLMVAAFFFFGLAMAKHKVNNIVGLAEADTNQPGENAAGPVRPPKAEVIGPAAIAVQAPRRARIQGIAYDPVHPWAIISGKTAYVGDVVDGMRVAVIARDSVTLVGNGQTNTFVVGQ